MGIGDRILASTAGLASAGRNEPSQANEGSPAVMARTAPGQMLAVHSGMIAMREELQTLHTRLKQFDGSMVTRLLDPASIKSTRWANRHEASFATQAFAGLKASIEQAGGNTQPILVRHTAEGRFEIVFGHRRHRACDELGLPVLAVLWDKPMSDVELFASMDRENRERADLSPYEQGASYQAAIGSGLFPSMRRLAETLGVSHTWVRKALMVAQLPSVVVSAFHSPIEIQPKHAEQIMAAMEVDREAVLRRAEQLRMSGSRAGPTQVVDHLISRDPGKSTKNAIRVGGTAIGTCMLDSRGRALIVIDSPSADTQSLDAVVEALKAMLRARAGIGA